MIKFFINSLFWKVFNIVASLLLGILLARLLSVDARGDYALFISVISFYTVILNFGIPESLVYSLQKEKNHESQLVKLGLLIPTIFFIILLVLYNILFFFDINIIYLTGNSIVFPLFMSLIFGSYNVLLRHLVLKDNNIPIFNLLSSIETISNMIIFFILFLLNKFTFLYVINVFAITTFLSFTVHVYYLKTQLNFYFTQKFLPKPNLLKKLLKLSIPLFILGLSGIFSSRLSLFVLDYFHESISVGFFSVAIIFPNLLLILPNQIAVLLYPVASGMENLSDLKLYGEKILKHVLFFSTILFVLGFIFLPLLIPLLYGQTYETVIPTSFIILIAVLFGGTNSVLLNLLVSHGETRVLLNNAIIIIFGIFSFSFLVYLYSYNGTALTLTIINIFCFVLNFKKYKQISNIKYSSLLISGDEIKLLLLRFKKIV
jgi:O-antigen/teichoic acid export membrane protein